MKDLTRGYPAKVILMFALPLILGNVLQQFYNMADAVIVGKFVGNQALAAVGSCVALVGIFVNLNVGLAVGPNAVLATVIGQNKRKRINRMIHTIITFGIIIGILLMIAGMLLARIVLEASGTPASVIDEALVYIRIYFLSIPFMVTYNFGSAILRSYGDTKRPMYYLMITGVVNIILNLILVICFSLGVAGVAIATLIANILSASLVLVHLYRRDDEFQFRFSKMRIEANDLKKILIIGIPAGIQGAIFSVSNVFIQSGVNSFGESAIAGSSLELNFEYFSYDIAVAFAQAAVTFTSQNFGAGNLKRCKKIFWECMLFGMGFTEILSIIFLIWDKFFIGIYTTSKVVAMYGILKLHRVCAWEGLTATYEVESAALRGMGKALEPSVVTVLGTVVFRMIWLVTIFRMVPTYEMLMDVYVASWIFTGGILFVIYMMHMRKIEKSVIK